MYQEMQLRFKHHGILSSKNSLYSNLMETGVTILCKTGKNKIKKNSFFFFNIKQYNHNTRIWNSSLFPMGNCRYQFSSTVLFTTLLSPKI